MSMEESVFEERAENLSETELNRWTYVSKAEELVLRKLKGPGAKLLSGPRGSGKSTLLRRAYFELIKERHTLPVYVNFSKALSLEPLFHYQANAVEIFRQWVIAKIIVGVDVALRDMAAPHPVSFQKLVVDGRELIHRLEVGTHPNAPSFSVSPSQLLDFLECWCKELRRSRCVLLMDDAAHAFSFRQQREFFEIFRELRSRIVSGKAAIYPGITSFSPSFHVGHEAELLEAWFRPDDESYISMMRQIAAMRVPSKMIGKLGASKEECLDALALASFGLPRGYLNLLSSVLDSISQSGAVNIKALVMEAVDAHMEATRAVFVSLSQKLPRYVNFVEMGEALERSVLSSIREYNRNKPLEEKTSTVAIGAPFPNELDRVLKFLEYAGIFRRLEDLSKGEKGVYRRYLVNYGAVISGEALFFGKNFRLVDLVGALKKRNSHSLVKAKATTFLGDDYSQKCTLSLPPCDKCGSARQSEEQRFCMSCGAELSNASVYMELLKAPISGLPLPRAKIEALQALCFLTVQDLLTDDEQKLRKRGSYIGKVWAKRIKTVAEEFVSV